MKIVLTHQEVAEIIGAHLAKKGVGHGYADICVTSAEVVFEKWGPAPAKEKKVGLRLIKGKPE